MTIPRREQRRTCALLATAAGLVALPACTFWDLEGWSAHAGEATSASVDAGVADVDGDVPVLARDHFSRTMTKGFGPADVGGTWRVTGNPDVYAVSNGTGTIALLAAGSGANAELPAVSTDDVDVQVVFSSDELGSGTGGSGLYFSVVGRHVGDNGYNAKVVLHTNGVLTAAIVRLAPDEVSLGAKSVLTLAAKQAFRTRFQVIGTSPTHLRVKTWVATDPEPPGWTLEADDRTPALQAKGFIGLQLYLSSGATNAPFSITVDELIVRPASRLP